jgi:hypothetical protein
MTSVAAKPAAQSEAATGQSAEQERAPEAKTAEKRAKEHDPLAHYDYTDDLSAR